LGLHPTTKHKANKHIAPNSCHKKASLFQPDTILCPSSSFTSLLSETRARVTMVYRAVFLALQHASNPCWTSRSEKGRVSRHGDHQWHGEA
jgi:hypothetical protein